MHCRRFHGYEDELDVSWVESSVAGITVNSNRSSQVVINLNEISDGEGGRVFFLVDIIHNSVLCIMYHKWSKSFP